MTNQLNQYGRRLNAAECKSVMKLVGVERGLMEAADECRE